MFIVPCISLLQSNASSHCSCANWGCFFQLCKFLQCLIGVYITVSMHYSGGLVYCQCKQTPCTVGLFWCMFAVGHMIYACNEYKRSTNLLLTPHIHTFHVHRYISISVFSLHMALLRSLHALFIGIHVVFCWLLKLHLNFFPRFWRVNDHIDLQL